MQDSQDLEKALLKVTPEKYGDSYQGHYLDQYKLYVEMTDRISKRRQSANSFFLALNTAIVGLAGYLRSGAENVGCEPPLWLISLAGIVLCCTWFRLVKSYRQLNSGKFKVIHEIEKRLPMSLYDAEWEILGRGKKPKLYVPFTRNELLVPWIFLILHGVMIVLHCLRVALPFCVAVVN